MRPHPATIERNLVRALVLTTSLWGATARAGSLSPELQGILQNTPATQKVSVILPMASQVDPNEVGGAMSGTGERLTEIVGSLKAKAIATQDVPICGRAGLLSELTALGSSQASNIRRLWVVNAVVVDATPDVIRNSGARGDIGEVHFAGDRVTEAPAATTSVPQWNITRVNAPAAWIRGFNGTGGIVASIDTGADATHPDLATNLLRNAGNVPVWLDAVAGQTAPYDDDGHGTHLLGVAVGQNGYGVAPGAKWMSCKAFSRSGTTLVTTAARILECAQWVLNPQHPTLTDTAAPDPAYLPDAVMSDLIISAAGYCDPFLRDILRAWRAVRILPVWSVGDDPNLAPVGAVPSPANDPATFSVAAADESDAILPTAFRGLAFCPGPTRMAPRLVAPGVNVTAAWTGGQRRTRGGSDVAAAHVAGAAALVRGARPDLRLVSVDVLDKALERTGDAVSGGQRRLNVDAAVTLEDATFRDQDPPPASMATGQTDTVTVTMENAGVTSWTAPAYQLTYVGAASSPWGIDTVALPVPTVLPGEAVAFTFPVTAPATPGAYWFEWQVCNGGTCFGARSFRTPVTVIGVDLATFVSQAVPCLTPGQPGSATVKLRNTGTTTWTYPAYTLGKLGTYSDPQVVNLSPGQTVVPNAEVTFTVPFTGPFPTGRYTFQRRMQLSGTWFGEAGPIYLVDTNVCTPDGAAVTLAAAPGELRVGQAGSAQALMTNNGLTTWRSGYCLRVSSVNGSGLPVVSSTSPISTCVTNPPTVAPTQSYWFIAPLVGQANREGRWPLSLLMYDDYGFSFGAGWSTTIGIPRDHQGSIEFAQGEGTQGLNNWFYRYYSGAANTWKKMTWKVDHWEGSGTGQIIARTWAYPGTSNSVGRFWKSPIWGWVRASATVSDLDSSCGDGVIVRLRKNTTLLGEWTLANGATNVPINLNTCVVPNDTIRFIVTARNNNNCDTTQFDPLVQVLPPAAPFTGPVPSEGPTTNPAVEAAGIIP